MIEAIKTYSLLPVMKGTCHPSPRQISVHSFGKTGNEHTDHDNGKHQSLIAWSASASEPHLVQLACPQHYHSVSKYPPTKRLEVYIPSGSLSLCSRRSILSLLRLLYALSRCLLLFALTDRLSASRRASLRAHRATLFDHIERSTDYGTLRFDLAASASFGLFLSRLSVGWIPSMGYVFCLPQKYPFSSIFGIALSMRCDVGSCVGGRGIRSCRFGSGILCCRRGRIVCPVAMG